MHEARDVVAAYDFSAPAVIRMDLLMLILLGARERTETEFRDLLRLAGFTVQRVIRAGSVAGLCIIEALPDTLPS